MKKIIVQILLFVIIFNSIFNSFCGCKVNAEEEYQGIDTGEYTVTPEEIQQADEDGTTTAKDGTTQNVDAADTQSTTASIMGNLISIITFIPRIVIQLIKATAQTFGYVDLPTLTTPKEKKQFTKFLTIEKIVFGNYYMLNANMFKNSTNLLVSDIDGASLPSDNAIDLIKENVSSWYYVLKLISLVLGLLTLIYIGIRMALSTVASDQAKYKKMLIGWVQSIGLILILPYIMRGLTYLNEVLIDLAKIIREGLIASGEESFENFILESVDKKTLECGGTELVAYCIAYIVLLIAEFKFFMMYLKRFFAVAFLTVISPLITITYSIDKAGDGKAQAFSAWIQEYTVNMLIQPLQAFIYLIFAFSANEIAKASPIVGIIFLLSLTRAEKIVKTIFNLRNMVSISTMKLFNKGK